MTLCSGGRLAGRRRRRLLRPGKGFEAWRSSQQSACAIELGNVVCFTVALVRPRRTLIRRRRRSCSWIVIARDSRLYAIMMVSCSWGRSFCRPAMESMLSKTRREGKFWLSGWNRCDSVRRLRWITFVMLGWCLVWSQGRRRSSSPRVSELQGRRQRQRLEVVGAGKSTGWGWESTVGRRNDKNAMHYGRLRCWSEGKGRGGGGGYSIEG